MTEGQESQWIGDFSLLCLKLYEESKLTGLTNTDQSDTMPSQ